MIEKPIISIKKLNCISMENLKSFIFICILLLLSTHVSPASANPLAFWDRVYEVTTVKVTRIADVTYGGNLFVAVGLFGRIVTSEDGNNWSEQTSGTTDHLLTVAYGNNVFVINGANIILISDDGIQWFPQSIAGFPSIPQFTDIVYGNGLFVAVGGSENTFTSPDGINWAPHGTGNINSINSITYGKGRFVAVGGEGIVLTSEDAINWNSQDSKVSGKIRSVAFGNNKFVASEDNSNIIYSDDGITWEIGSQTLSMGSIVFGNGVFLGVSGSNIKYSLDAITFTTVFQDSDSSLSKSTYGIDFFVTVGEERTNKFGIILKSDPYNISISGRVHTAIAGHSNLPVSGASVSLSGTAYSTATGADGTFQFEDIADGTYQLVVRSSDFRDWQQNVNVTFGNIQVLDITLQPSTGGVVVIPLF